MDQNLEIKKACDHFKTILEEQFTRLSSISTNTSKKALDQQKEITLGFCWGDGIGPIICKQAQHVLETIIKHNKNTTQQIKIITIDNLTIENRAHHKKAIPDDILETLKTCDVILKGPTTTPQKGDQWPNIESANVAMRRELDLFACVRPIKVPKDKIDWTIFRENTEGAYALGSKGITLGDTLSIDFKMATDFGTERIVKMAFDYAKQNGKKRVTVVTKSNVIKTTDGRFSDIAKRIAKEYEADGISCDEWYIDIMTAKLLDKARRSEFEVMVMPNLYGDILSDEAGQIQGGVGTAGSANIGSQYAMFEAIHGSAPRMIEDGREQYADPSSMIKATAMCLRHIGWTKEADKLDMALEICGQLEQKHRLTGRNDGVDNLTYSNYILDWYLDPNLESRYTELSGNN